MPQSDAGVRIEPPVSVPSAAAVKPDATAAPEPLLDPPEWCSLFHGLRAGGHGRSNDGPPCANSCVESLPTNTAPASYSFRTAVASFSGKLRSRMRECALVSTP